MTNGHASVPQSYDYGYSGAHTTYSSYGGAGASPVSMSTTAPAYNPYLGNPTVSHNNIQHGKGHTSTSVSVTHLNHHSKPKQPPAKKPSEVEPVKRRGRKRKYTTENSSGNVVPSSNAFSTFPSGLVTAQPQNRNGGVNNVLPTRIKISSGKIVPVQQHSSDQVLPRPSLHMIQRTDGYKNHKMSSLDVLAAVSYFLKNNLKNGNARPKDQADLSILQQTNAVQHLSTDNSKVHVHESQMKENQRDPQDSSQQKQNLSNEQADVNYLKGCQEGVRVHVQGLSQSQASQQRQQAIDIDSLSDQNQSRSPSSPVLSTSQSQEQYNGIVTNTPAKEIII